MDIRGVLVLSFCSLAIVNGQKESDASLYTARLLPSTYGLGWRGYVIPVYGGEKTWISDDNTGANHAHLSDNDYLSRFERSMTEKMKTLKGRYNGKFRDILFGK
ncbi:hypothetical protein DICVIV_09257 [Dictyocaulus viviparus]|uniref:Uncharacterized protein n=1 Tax=Dictyocaulus viviparus TaxID=29172 RepID=A0A0D8XJB6_DICVI|nr:hypothetical protein DICVIV_09257 [Dictyocaulus viviparus]